ncbi:MAG: hypothetical protein AAGU11_16225 [Syntrophobacteraceae bacterium]
MGNVGKCSGCGRDKKLIGKGLCCACYHKARRERIKAGAVRQPKFDQDFTIHVDFTPMAFLLEEIKKRAGAELRDVGPQILWELNKSIGGVSI